MNVWPEAETPLGGVFEEAQRTGGLIVLLHKEGELPTYEGASVTPEQLEQWERNGVVVYSFRIRTVKSREAD